MWITLGILAALLAGILPCAYLRHKIKKERRIIQQLRQKISHKSQLDIAELKEASYKLAQSEALLKEAEAISHNGSWEWSQEKSSFFWSDELYRIHGLEPDSPGIDLRFYLTLIHPEDVQRFVTILADTQTTLSPFSIEYRIIRPDGETRYLLLNGKFKTDLQGTVQTIVGNTQDITELKHTSLLLDRSESIYRTIAKNVPDSAVFLYDKKKELLLVEGPAIAKIDPLNQINTGTSVYKLLKDDPEEHSKFLDLALKGKESRIEYRINQGTFKISYTPVYSSQREIFGIMVVMHDITDIKKAQHELENKVTELNRSNQDLEQFAYIASHDLQEPLRKIRAFTDLLRNRYLADTPEEAQDYFYRIRSAADRMQLMIDELLTFSKLSRPTEDFVPVNLNHIVKEVLFDLEYAIEKSKASVTVDAGITIKAIPSQLRQLFQNIISNSLKFNQENLPPVISIKARLTESQGSLPPSIPDTDRQYCSIEIQDNGIGFNPQYAGKIFILFQRLHSKSEYDGTGIGLALCKKIVENHGGSIEAESKEKEGALFRIILPVNIN